ncbi:MAG: alpha-L-fucosidase [Planctomycetota bacterium]
MRGSARVGLAATPPLALALGLFLGGGCAAHIEARTQPLVAPPAPHGATPSARQVRWHERDLYAFLHFTTNTFTDREWGYGDESPTVFAPTDFDADQIVGTLEGAGFRGVILTCKHHDGFCLWPTDTTDHDVAASPFRGGDGDVVREISEACARHGVAFAPYVSPWDRNSALYGTSEYVTEVFRPQIAELLTRYGPVFEVWFDGANGGDGFYGGANETRSIDRTTYYGWDETWTGVRALSDDAVIFSDVGPDVRWVGNERGVASDPCWATFTPKGPDGGEGYGPGLCDYADSGSGTVDGARWIPAECDVSIRPGWFWHASESDRVKSVDELWDLYLASVGRGASLLLNVPPDRRGQLDAPDVRSLEGFGARLRATFTNDLAQGAELRASAVRGDDALFYGPRRLVDGDRWSAWCTDDDVREASVTLTLPEPRAFDLVRLREDVRLGQRVRGLAVDVWTDGAWAQRAEVRSIGACRLIALDEPVTTDRVRVRITAAAASPALSEIGLFWTAAR